MDILIRPVDITVAVRSRIPRHMIVVREVLRDVQDRTAGVAAPVEDSTVLVGSDRFVIAASTAHVQIRLLEVLRTVLVVRVTLVRLLTTAIHDVVAMTRSVRLANSTEVDVGVAVGIVRDPQVVVVLVWNTSFGCDRFLVFATLIAFSLDLFESRLKSLGARIELRLGALELSACALVFCLGSVERTLARIEVILSSLESGLGGIVLSTSRTDIFDEPTCSGGRQLRSSPHLHRHDGRELQRRCRMRTSCSETPALAAR